MENLINKTKELKNYEKKFNLLKGIPANSINSSHVNYKTNYMTDDYLLNFNINKLNRLNTKENIDKILRHELEQMNFDIKIKNVNDLQNKVTYFFNRYNFIIKNIIEDNWILYKKDLQTKYELKDGEFVFDNSVLIKDKENETLIYFLKRLFKLCNILAKQINYKVHTKFYDDEYHEICWLIFVFAKN